MTTIAPSSTRLRNTLLVARRNTGALRSRPPRQGFEDAENPLIKCRQSCSLADASQERPPLRCRCAATLDGVRWYDRADTYVDERLIMETILLSTHASVPALVGATVAVWIRL